LRPHEGYSPKKWICQAFPVDRCWRAVAGKHRHLVSKREQFVSDPGYEQIDISAGQITSPNTSGKKDIAANE